MYPDKHYQNSLWTLIEKKKNSYKIINNPSKENPPKQMTTEEEVSFSAGVM